MTLNAQVARRLDEVAELLQEQGANLFRVQAYRRGADSVRRLQRPVSEILEQEGIDGLRNLPGVGDRLALAIRDLVTTGRLPMLDRLKQIQRICSKLFRASDQFKPPGCTRS
jgi:putative hydrolase